MHNIFCKIQRRCWSKNRGIEYINKKNKNVILLLQQTLLQQTNIIATNLTISEKQTKTIKNKQIKQKGN